MKNRCKLVVVAATALFLSNGQSNALTLKTGEVLGSDGKVYSGASPEQLSKMEESFKDSGKKAQVIGDILFVDVLGKAVSMSVKELQSKKGADLDKFIDMKIEDALSKGAAKDAAKDKAKDAAKGGGKGGGKGGRKP